jgi:WD40 repeat protein
MAFSRDGDTLVIGLRNGTVYLWRFKAEKTPINEVDASRGGKRLEAVALHARLFCAYADGVVYEFENGKVLRTHGPILGAGMYRSVECAEFSPTQNGLVIFDYGGTLLVYDMHTWGIRARFECLGHGGAFAFFPDGIHMAYECREGVTIVELTTLVTKMQFEYKITRSQRETSIKISPRGTFLLYLCGESFQVWKVLDRMMIVSIASALLETQIPAYVTISILDMFLANNVRPNVCTKTVTFESISNFFHAEKMRLISAVAKELKQKRLKS